MNISITSATGALAMLEGTHCPNHKVADLCPIVSVHIFTSYLFPNPIILEIVKCISFNQFVAAAVSFILKGGTKDFVPMAYLFIVFGSFQGFGYKLC